MIVHREHRERCGEAGGAERGGPARGSPFGKADEAVGADVGALGKPAVPGFAEPVSVEDDAVAWHPPWIVAAGDGADEVDAGHERKDAGDAAVASEGERILVIEA